MFEIKGMAPLNYEERYLLRLEKELKKELRTVKDHKIDLKSGYRVGDSVAS